MFNFHIQVIIIMTAPSVWPEAGQKYSCGGRGFNILWIVGTGLGGGRLPL